MPGPDSQVDAQIRKASPTLRTARARTSKVASSRCEGECGQAVAPGGNPDHSYALPRIRRIQGQLSGVERMIHERRYCPEVLIQTRAIHSAVKALEGVILESHIRGCVRDAMTSENKRDVDSKISELMDLFLKN